MEKALAIPPTQSTFADAAERTATGASIRQSNSQARMAKEQVRVLRWLLRIIRKFDSLVQRWADDDDYVEIVGPDGVKRLALWNRHVIAGRFAYDASLDSQLWVDANVRREQLLKAHNYFGASPYINQKEWQKSLVAALGFDAARLIVDPPPPEPEKPNISFRFSGPDLASPLVLAILVKAGYVTDEEAATLPPPVQQETAEEAPRLSKSAGEETGKISGPTEQPRIQ